MGKDTGPRGINNILLKQLSKPLTNPLSDLFKYSFAHGTVPTTRKRHILHPFMKGMTHQKYSIIHQFKCILR